MSDYISKSALIEALNKEAKEFEDCVLMPTWYSALSVFHNQPTLDEKEIIRKPFERVVERLEEQKQQSDRIYNELKDSFYLGMIQSCDNAIEIVKEECGINE